MKCHQSLEMAPLINTVRRRRSQKGSANKKDFKKLAPEKLKQQIAKSSQIIREKYNFLKGQTEASDNYFRERLESVTIPLQQSVTSEIKGLHRPLERLIDRVGMQNREEMVEGDNTLLTKQKNIDLNKLFTPNEEQFSYEPRDSEVREEEEEASSSHLNVLQKLKNTPKAQKYAEEILPHLSDHLQYYVRKYLKSDVSDLDNQFGIKFNGKEWIIGNSSVKFSEDDFIIVGGEKFKGSEGLYNLLFEKIPNQEVIQHSDLESYKRILEISSAHKKTYSANKNIASNRGYKYKIIIAPLFQSSRKEQTGSGINALKTKYEYYYDVNQIVDRLKLLIASSVAGNDSHMNEITSIISQLRQHGVIV